MTRIFFIFILLCYQRKIESKNLTKKFCKSYVTHYISDFCNPASTYTIFAHESGSYSSGIFRMTRNNTPYALDRNCEITLQIPDNYKILISFFHVDIRKSEYGDCIDQLQISRLSNKLILKPICGKWYNRNGDRVIFPLSSFIVRFKTNETGYNQNHTGFSFMYTVYNNSEDGVCYGEDRFKCKSNNICIWKSLLCDGYNNCVDGSDEKNCYGYTNSVGIGGYIGLTFAIILLIMILLFLVSPPIKRNSSRVPEISTISSSCQWHTGTSNFPPPYSEIADRPPSYEEAVRTNTS